MIKELSRAFSSLLVLPFVLRPLAPRTAFVPMVRATISTFSTTMAPTASKVILKLCDT